MNANCSDCPASQCHARWNRPHREVASSWFMVPGSVVLTGCLALSASAATFRGLGDLPGGDFASWADAISPDGRVVVGTGTSSSGKRAFRWTEAAGMESLGVFPGAIASSGYAVSADGLVVVGTSGPSSMGSAFRWTQAGGLVALGDLPGGEIGSIPHAVSANGEIIVGESSSLLSGTGSEAFRWTLAEGMIGLGDLPGGKYRSSAYAVSADGSVVVGYSSSANASSGVAEAFRWTQATGMVALGDFPGSYFNSIAYGVSADGSVVVGRGYPAAVDEGTHKAFRWTAESGMVPLGFAPGDQDSVAYAVTADGNMIVGDDPYPLPGYALLWDPQHGMRHLDEVLVEDYGLDLAGWRLTSARAISADGNTIAGSGRNPTGHSEAWVVTGLRPTLTLSKTNDTCWLSWPVSAADFTLQSSDNLSSGWSNVVASVLTNGSLVGVTQDGSGRTRFFRLRKP